ncbi:MAG: metallophosphoesterase family protein [Clostridiales bacterium]|nr:metallophosphoesterase family protein [Clostridiales bacterium]
MIYFTSDLHLGHKNCIDFCSRPFASVDEMDEALISGWNNRVKNDDTVYIVGDLVWESSDPLKYVKQLNGKKILIIGNHDVKWLKRYGIATVSDDGRVELRDYAEYFINIAQYVETSVDGVTITLCHYPMLEWKASRKLGSKKLGYLIHGHIHNSRDKKYMPLWQLPHALNAGVDINNYAPVTFDELIKNNEAFKLSALSIND